MTIINQELWEPRIALMVQVSAGSIFKIRNRDLLAIVAETVSRKQNNQPRTFFFLFGI